MSLLQAVILGIVQGLTEFLPISSQAHLFLVPYLFGWTYQGLDFDIALHWGTLLAVLLVFGKDYLRYLRALFIRGEEGRTERRLGGLLVLATIPAAVAGLFAKDLAESQFRNPLIMVVTLSVFAVLLWLADRYLQKSARAELSAGKSLAIGVAQAIAIIPGVADAAFFLPDEAGPDGITRLTAFVENRSQSPEAAFGDTLLVTLAQGHPRGRPMTPQLVAEADLDVALAFYRDRFADLGDFTFFFVGNVDPAVLRPLVETWLGGLPSAGRKETWRDIGMRPPTGIVRKVVRRGLEPKARTQFVFTGPFTDSREHRHAMRSMRDALQIRLREVLREDMGGVYGVGVGASSSIIPDTTFQVTIGFGADPARLDELVEAVVAEIRALQTAGPSDSVLQKVKESQRRSLETSMRENRYWLGQLVAAQRYGTDPRNLLSYEELISALSADDIRRAAQLYIRLDNYVQVTLMPEAPSP